jgi:cell filamentation protein
MSDEVYCYPPDYTVLKNRLDIRDAAELDRIERRTASQRAAEPIPSGSFNLAHLRAIHRHLFQDVYDWAGELRTVEISKGASQFQFRRYIETGMADVHRRIVAWNQLRGLDAETFA